MSFLEWNPFSLPASCFDHLFRVQVACPATAAAAAAAANPLGRDLSSECGTHLAFAT